MGDSRASIAAVTPKPSIRSNSSVCATRADQKDGRTRSTPARSSPTQLAHMSRHVRFEACGTETRTQHRLGEHSPPGTCTAPESTSYRGSLLTWSGWTPYGRASIHFRSSPRLTPKRRCPAPSPCCAMTWVAEQPPVSAIVNTGASSLPATNSEPPYQP